MTTIIATLEEIAGDGLSCDRSDRILGYREEKIRVRDGAIYAVSGAACVRDALIIWHKKGADPKEIPKLEDGYGWTMLVIDAKGAFLLTSSAPYKDPVDLPFALGSGGDYALGAIAAGADARRAIEIAAIYDRSTGGEIQVVNITQALTGELFPIAAE
jgi:hypothetical protein